jgi:hypothetical protein
MRLKRKEGHDYIFWRPRPKQIGRHPVTVVFEGKETSEQEITIYVDTRDRLKALREATEEKR